MEVEKKYKIKHGDDRYELVFATDWNGDPEVKIIRKAVTQLDNDNIMRLPPDIAVKMAQVVIKEHERCT